MAHCDHFWRTVEEPGYGWVSICEGCGSRESAEHSEACFDQAIRLRASGEVRIVDLIDPRCICGAGEEFAKYETGVSQGGHRQ